MAVLSAINVTRAAAPINIVGEWLVENVGWVETPGNITPVRGGMDNIPSVTRDKCDPVNQKRGLSRSTLTVQVAVLLEKNLTVAVSVSAPRKKPAARFRVYYALLLFGLIQANLASGLA